MLIFLKDELAKVSVSKWEVEKIIDRKLDEKLGKFPTKDEFYKIMDELMGELRDSRMDREILNGKVSA